MNLQTLAKIRRLREKYGAGVTGKLIQKLLAITFNKIGFKHIVERSVEGVDIDISGESGKYALEVKTTESSFVNISKENIAALHKRIRDGYIPVIVAIRLAALERWIFSKIPISELTPGKTQIDTLRAYRSYAIEQLISPAFEMVVNEHFQGTLVGGQQYLSEHLKLIGVETDEI